MSDIKKVGVLGCGLMGSGIAQIAAQAGYETVVREVEQRFLDKGLAGIDKSLGKFSNVSKIVAYGSGGDDIIDAHDLSVPVVLFGGSGNDRLPVHRVETLAPKDALFASNTSSLTITELSMATARPKQFVGLHFFNPVPLMKLVEVVRTILTSDESFDRAFTFAKSLGKEAVAARDNSGFIVNRLLVPYILDAIRAYEEGVGSIEDIDKAMMLGCGYPMGPFTLLDFVGLDTTYFITDVMFAEYQEKRFAAPPLLRKMVLAGRLGRNKTGTGFYDYTSGTPIAFDKAK